jgi:DNA-binding IclR family transcriptional regulator
VKIAFINEICLIMSIAKNSTYEAPALDKGLDILERLSLSSVAQSQAEIAKSLGRAVNEIYRMLSRLEARGYVVREEQSGKYRLSLKLYQMAHIHSPIQFLRTAAIGPMRQLAESLRQSCHLSVIDSGKLLVVVQGESPDPVSLSIAEGGVFPLLTTASGQLLLAFCGNKRREELLAADQGYRKMTESQRQKLARWLEAIREAGCLRQPSQITRGVSDISVLVGKPDVEPNAALTISCIATSLHGGTGDKRLLSEARHCAKLVGQAAGLV